MIITKNWLKQWLDLDLDTQDLVNTLNQIGLEVSKTQILKAPDKVVVGLVKEKRQIENSKKLSLVIIDIGNELLEVVCGASNIQANQYICLALEGCVINNTVIKETTIFNTKSKGMVCSSTELGFAKINQGILVLDNSIGELELGKELNTYECFNDVLIELELTPNRGDCLSVYGIARDLSVVLNLNLKESKAFKDSDNVLGIGRILRLSAEKELNSHFIYRVVELKDKLEANLLIKLRLALGQNLSSNEVENYLNYASCSTGVLFNAYDLKENTEEITLNLSKESKNQTKISFKNELLSISGIYQNPNYKASQESKLIIIEANYTKPSVIAEAKNLYKTSDEKTLYRSFRGSEPNLMLGINFLLLNLENSLQAVIYSSSKQILQEENTNLITLNLESINNIIGQEIDKDEIVRILKKLGFEIILSDKINTKAPLHRDDIKNLADICEEIVRIIGIENIKSKKLEFSEQNRTNQSYITYKEFLKIRQNCAFLGYFENLSYVLDSKQELLNLGFNTVSLELVNPLNQDLDTLRTSLLNHLIKAASLNAKNSKKLIKLFELGIVFNQANQERTNLALLHSGYKEEPKISNKAKPSFVNFYDFLLDLKNIIGNFSLEQSNKAFLSPYERAEILVNKVKVGYIGRLHLQIETQNKLAPTYVCELDLTYLKPSLKQAKIYSKFPSIHRDLSVVIPKGYNYSQIKENIKSLNISSLENFNLVDIYTNKDLQEFYSITIHFIFRDLNKTLEEEEVNTYIEQILTSLKNMGLALR